VHSQAIRHFRTLEIHFVRLIYGASERKLQTKSGENKMNVILRKPAFPVLHTRALDSSFERLVNNLLENAPLAPRMNVVETGTAYRVEAEMPGVNREDVKISVDKKRVSIEAESKVATEVGEGEKALLTERTTRKFARAFTLASEVDDEAAAARLENGVLILTLPKKAVDQPRQIAVQ
jgi:HSP20 family protein